MDDTVMIRVSATGDERRTGVIQALINWGFKSEQIRYINRFQFIVEDSFDAIVGAIIEITQYDASIDIMGVQGSLVEAFRRDAKRFIDEHRASVGLATTVATAQ